MAQPLQQTYTSGAATEMALTRVEKIKKTDNRYSGLYKKYQHTLIHYRANHPILQVGDREYPTSFVDGMIALWQTCGKDEKIRLNTEAVKTMVNEPAQFIAKASKTYSQAKAGETLGVSRQTIIHWMNKGWMDYISLGDTRRALKREVAKMLEYAKPAKSKLDSTRYKPYFVWKGVWQDQVHTTGRKKTPLDEAQEEIASLEEKVSNLQDKLLQTSKANTKLKARNQKLGEMNETLTRQNKEIRADRREVKKEKANLEREKAQLEREKASSQQKYAELEQQLAASTKSYGQLEKQLAQAAQQYSKLEKKLNALQDKYAQSQKALSSSKEDKKGLYGQVKESQKKILAAQKSNEKLEAQIADLTQQNADLQQQITEAVAGDSEATNAIGKLKSAYDKRIQQLTTKAEQLTGKVNKLTELNDKINSLYRDAQGTIKKLQKDMASKKTIDVTKTKEYKALQKTNYDLTRQLEKLEARLGKENTTKKGKEPKGPDIGELHSQFEELSKQYTELEEQNATLTSQNEQLVEENLGLKKGRITVGRKAETNIYMIDGGPYKVGQRIKHPTRGEGEVTSYSEHYSVGIRFDGEDKARSFQLKKKPEQ